MFRRKTIAAVAIAPLMIATFATQAQAGGGYGWGAFAAGTLTGIAVGAAVAGPPVYAYYPAPVYVPPPPVAVYAPPPWVRYAPPPWVRYGPPVAVYGAPVVVAPPPRVIYGPPPVYSGYARW